MDQATKSELKALPITHQPYPAESFLGYLTRVAQLNLRKSALELAELAKVDKPVLSDLQRRGDGENEIAVLCGVQAYELRRRRHMCFGGQRETVCLAAGSITAHLVRTNRPRIAAKAFADIGYHKYEWDFEFLTFDPETGEELIDACPHCDTELSWSHPDFVNCGSCGRTLAPQGRLRVGSDEQRAGEVFAGLLSLDEGHRVAAREHFSPEVRNLPTEELFRFLFEISNLYEFKKYTKRERPTELHWNSVLIRAYQIATDWPDALLALLEETRIDADARGGRFGVRKEFGDLGVLLREWDDVAEIKAVVLPVIRKYLQQHPEIPLKANSLLSRGVDLDSRYATLSEIRHEYGWGHQKASRLLSIPGVVIGASEGSGAPMRIDRLKVAEIHDALQEMITRRTIRNIWGIPHDAINQLVESGIFQKVDEPYVCLVQAADGLFRRDQVADVMDRAHSCDRSYDGITWSLNKLAFELGREIQNPWPIVVAAILDGDLQPAKISKKDKAGFGRIRVSKDEADRWLAIKTRRGENTLSLEETSKRLSIKREMLCWIISKGLLKVHSSRVCERGRRISSLELIRFEGIYISPGSLAIRLKGRSEAVSDTLNVLGVRPIVGCPDGIRLYRLSDLPKNFRILTRREVNERRRQQGLPLKMHPWHGGG